MKERFEMKKLYQHDETGRIYCSEDELPTIKWTEVPLMFEDRLPEDITDEEYTFWYDNSFLDRVRVGPKIERIELMKKRFEVTRCEYCDSLIELGSPPLEKRYDNAEISIREGTVLLPGNIVRQRIKEGLRSGHTADLSGRYCTPQCLINKLNSILTVPLSGVEKEIQQAKEEYAECVSKSLKKDKRYIIFKTPSIADLEDKINECTGYVPVGNISTIYDSSGDGYIEYLQLMEKM